MWDMGNVGREEKTDRKIHVAIKLYTLHLGGYGGLGSHLSRNIDAILSVKILTDSHFSNRVFN